MTCMPVRSPSATRRDVYAGTIPVGDASVTDFFAFRNELRHLAKQELPRSHGTVPKNQGEMAQVASTAWHVDLEEKLIDLWQERHC